MRIRERFNPRAPCGARPSAIPPLSLSSNFNPRAPCGARQWHRHIELFAVEISTHAPLAGRDLGGVPSAAEALDFNPRAPCGARRAAKRHVDRHTDISTHAPLAGRDIPSRSPPLPLALFQPTRPLRGATFSLSRTTQYLRFQPTRPLRGATPAPSCPWRCPPHFNPRAPCGARPYLPCRPPGTARISTHAPLAGRDRVIEHSDISTHAPLAGRDSKSVQITMHIFAITDKFQMLLHRMPPVRAFCSFLMQENHADFGCEPPK